jgi:hypothetical protein
MDTSTPVAPVIPAARETAANTAWLSESDERSSLGGERIALEGDDRAA